MTNREVDEMAKSGRALRRRGRDHLAVTGAAKADSTDDI